MRCIAVPPEVYLTLKVGPVYRAGNVSTLRWSAKERPRLTRGLDRREHTEARKLSMFCSLRLLVFLEEAAEQDQMLFLIRQQRDAKVLSHVVLTF